MPSAESDELRQMKGQWSSDRQQPDRRRRHWPLLRLPIGRTPGEKAARVPLGSYEFEKKGIARVDLGDPYRLAIALTWPQFLAALLGLYLAVNVVFATLFLLVPGCVANARPGNFADVFFFRRRPGRSKPDARQVSSAPTPSSQLTDRFSAGSHEGDTKTRTRTNMKVRL